MPTHTPPEIVDLLTAGKEDDLVGEEESRRFDAKSQPYWLAEDAQKWELAKDVSVMANADGGLILITAMTEKAETFFEEHITEIVPVSQQLVDQKQYHDSIAAWTFPLPPSAPPVVSKAQ